MAARLIVLNHRRTREQNRAFVTECPLSEYDALTRSAELQQLVQRISMTTDGEQQRQLKSALPFRCPHYTRFRDNHRDREHIDPESFTWQTCVDIDDPELVEKANMMSEKLDIQAGGEWQCMMLHKDYSARRKLHIDIRLPIGMTVPRHSEHTAVRLVLRQIQAVLHPSDLFTSRLPITRFIVPMAGMSS